MHFDIEQRERRAMQLFKEGYNCSQSVALAFSDIIEQKQGMTEDQIRAVMSGFGGGFGRLREVCGTVSGMTFVAGAVCPAPATAPGSSPATSTGTSTGTVTESATATATLTGTATKSVTVSGAATSIGTAAEAQKQKTRNYELVQSLVNSFRQENGSIICRELLDFRIKGIAGQPQIVNQPQPVAQSQPVAQPQPAGQSQLAAMQSSAPTPSERTPEYYKARPCEQLVGIAARILAARLNGMDRLKME